MGLREAMILGEMKGILILNIDLDCAGNKGTKRYDVSYVIFFDKIGYHLLYFLICSYFINIVFCKSGGGSMD